MPELRVDLQRRQAVLQRVQVRAAERQLWLRYERLCEKLPQWLRQHGLRLTLDYLRMLARGRSSHAAAQALLEDWADLSASAIGAPALPTTQAGANGASAVLPAPDAAGGLLLLMLALADAEAFRRSCKLVAAGLSDRQGDGFITAAGLPVIQAHPALQFHQCGHAGIAWRYCGDVGASEDDATWRTRQVQAVVGLSTSGPYRLQHNPWYENVYQRHVQWLQALPPQWGTRTQILRLRSHLFIGLGERGVWETQALLHPVTGMPWLPASQIKSLVRRTMQARLQRLPAEASRLALRALLDDLLGEVAGDGAGGLLVVHDAWWVHDAGAGPLVGDVDNNHHTQYLQGADDHPRALPQDSPQPHPQLAVRGAFLFALGIQPAAGEAGPPLVARCMRWLAQALAEQGIGGRAWAAGAGRFASQPLDAQPPH